MPESEWRATCYKGRRNGCRRRRKAAAAAAAARLSRSSSRSSSNDKTSEREKSTEPIRHTVTALNNAPTQSWSEWARGKGFMRRTRSKGSKKRPGRGKRTTKRRRH